MCIIVFSSFFAKIVLFLMTKLYAPKLINNEWQTLSRSHCFVYKSIIYEETTTFDLTDFLKILVTKCAFLLNLLAG